MRILIAGLLAAIAAVVSPPAPAVAQDIDAETLARVIAKKTEQLQLKPHTTESISERVLRFQKAIKSADYDAARSISMDVLQHSKLQNWRYYPLDAFMKDLSDVGDPIFEAHLNDWVMQNPTNVAPVLIRAQYNYDQAWERRGHEFSSTTSNTQFTEFHKYIDKAQSDIDQAIKLDPTIPYSYYLRTSMAKGTGNVAAMSSFEDAISKFPSYYPLYETTLIALQPRWFGDYSSMQKFVDQYAGNVPNDSALKMLYLDLYRYFLSSASVACDQGRDTTDTAPRCVANEMAKLITPELDQNVDMALHLFDRTDQQQFRVRIYTIVNEMFGYSGADALSGAMLARVATAMHSDTRRQAIRTHNSDYVIDELTGNLWWRKEYESSALDKYKESLKDANGHAFPSELERDEVLAYIYTQLARLSSRLAAYTDAIVYKQAAVTLGDSSDEEYICFGYYKLKHFDEAVQSCTAATDRKHNWFAIYWRGMSHMGLGQIDSAIQDLTKVEKSRNAFHSNATGTLISLYLNHNYQQKALDEYTQHPELFDDNKQSKAILAQNFNNRCYAYMEVGELQKALDDCNRSIGFGGLPDTFIKQQKLRRQLSQ